MRLVILANQNWGIEAIEALRNDYEISQVFTHPSDMDKHDSVWYDSVEDYCKNKNLPVKSTSNLDDDDFKKIEQINPDLIVSVNWRRLVPKRIFQLPKLGMINIHPSLLPKYRGMSPINWVVINGETESGITVHFVDETADTGDIILQKKFTISETETAKDVYDKSISLYPSIMKETLKILTSSTFVRKSQNKMEPRFFYSRRFPKDGKIDWNNSREKIFNLIRGLSDPYPNAFFYYNNKQILVKTASLVKNDLRGLPGRICSITDDGIIVTCGNNNKNQALLIQSIMIDGEKKSANKFFRKLWIDLQ